MDITKFIISDNQYLKFHFEQLEKLSPNVCIPCYKIEVDYVNDKQNIDISFGYTEVSHVCYFFTKSSLISQLLNNKMNLSNDKIDNLGLEINQYFEGVSESDVCFNYLFLSNSHKRVRPYYNSWLYNDEIGNIVFEITPFYPWHDPAEADNPNFLSYETWIKDYKPIVKTTIPFHSLKQWIYQIKKWCKILENNDHKESC